jgi:hypothetical protein
MGTVVRSATIRESATNVGEADTLSKETHTKQSIILLGESHALAGTAPLVRKNFETDAFYLAYMDGYNRGSKFREVKKQEQVMRPYGDPWSRVPFAASGVVNGSGIFLHALL